VRGQHTVNGAKQTPIKVRKLTNDTPPTQKIEREQSIKNVEAKRLPNMLTPQNTISANIYTLK
jgi:hypothetical protein